MANNFCKDVVFVFVNIMCRICISQQIAKCGKIGHEPQFHISTSCLKHFVIIMVSRWFKRIPQTIISYSNRGQSTFKRHAVMALFLSLPDRQQGEGNSWAAFDVIFMRQALIYAGMLVMGESPPRGKLFKSFNNHLRTWIVRPKFAWTFSPAESFCFQCSCLARC